MDPIHMAMKQMMDLSNWKLAMWMAVLRENMVMWISTQAF